MPPKVATYEPGHLYLVDPDRPSPPRPSRALARRVSASAMIDDLLFTAHQTDTDLAIEFACSIDTIHNWHQAKSAPIAARFSDLWRHWNHAMARHQNPDAPAQPWTKGL